MILPNPDSLYFFYFLLCIYAAPKMPVNVSFHPLMLICSATQSSPQGDLKNLLELLMCFIYHHHIQEPVTMIEQQSSCLLLSLLVSLCLYHHSAIVFVRDCEQKWESKVPLMTDPRLQDFPEQMMINLITQSKYHIASFIQLSHRGGWKEAGRKDAENRLWSGMREKKKFLKASREAEEAFHLQGFAVHPEVFLRC